MSNQPLAYRDRRFLDSEEARPIRIISEYLEPLRRFRQQNIQDTVVFFGSARVHSRIRAEGALKRLRNGRHGEDYAAALKRSRKAVQWSRYYEDARTLAKLLTKWSVSLDAPRHRFVVCSGGGPGIMEAANRGAHDAGGKTIGLNIRLPFEQGANRYITPGLHFEFHYFFMSRIGGQDSPDSGSAAPGLHRALPGQVWAPASVVRFSAPGKSLGFFVAPACSLRCCRAAHPRRPRQGRRRCRRSAMSRRSSSAARSRRRAAPDLCR